MTWAVGGGVLGCKAPHCVARLCPKHHCFEDPCQTVTSSIVFPAAQRGGGHDHCTARRCSSTTPSTKHIAASSHLHTTTHHPIPMKTESSMHLQTLNKIILTSLFLLAYCAIRGSLTHPLYYSPPGLTVPHSNELNTITKLSR